MLLARCYNNEGLETEVSIGQYVDVKEKFEGFYGICTTFYGIYKRSTGELLFNMPIEDFGKCFEIINN